MENQFIEKKENEKCGEGDDDVLPQGEFQKRISNQEEREKHNHWQEPVFVGFFLRI